MSAAGRRAEVGTQAVAPADVYASTAANDPGPTAGRAPATPATQTCRCGADVLWIRGVAVGRRPVKSTMVEADPVWVAHTLYTRLSSGELEPLPWYATAWCRGQFVVDGERQPQDLHTASEDAPGAVLARRVHACPDRRQS